MKQTCYSRAAPLDVVYPKPPCDLMISVIGTVFPLHKQVLFIGYRFDKSGKMYLILSIASRSLERQGSLNGAMECYIYLSALFVFDIHHGTPLGQKLFIA